MALERAGAEGACVLPEVSAGATQQVEAAASAADAGRGVRVCLPGRAPDADRGRPAGQPANRAGSR